MHKNDIIARLQANDSTVLSLLKGKSDEEQLEIAYEYAQDNIDTIPVADNAEYIGNSDTFEMEDISWEE